MINKSLLKKIKLPILITGSSGFIGANLTRFFVEQGICISVILRNKDNWRINDIIKKVDPHYLDLNNSKKLKKTINQIKPKTIFHLATYGGYPNQRDLYQIHRSNLCSTINLLKECEKYNYEKFINTGSSSEYGNKIKSMKEGDFLEPDSHYAIFKSAANHFCTYEALNKKLPIINVRPFHVYGPYEDRNRLIPTLILDLMNDRSPPLVSPKTSRDFIYVDDVIKYYLSLATKKNINGETFNIGSGKKSSIERVFFNIKKILNSKTNPNWNSMPSRSWDKNIWLANMKKTNSILKIKNDYTLIEGLKKNISWFMANEKLYKD